MASIKTYAELIAYFEAGDKPTQGQFEDLIYTMMNGLASQPKKYVALLSQVSTGAPTVESNGSGANTPFINTLGSVTLARTNTGRYTLTSAGLFGASLSKCDIKISLNAGSGYEFYAEWTSANVISISTFNAGSFSDDILLNSSVEITVYP